MLCRLVEVAARQPDVARHHFIGLLPRPVLIKVIPALPRSRAGGRLKLGQLFSPAAVSVIERQIAYLQQEMRQLSASAVSDGGAT